MNNGSVTSEAERARRALLQEFRWVGGHADVWRVFEAADVFTAVVGGLVEPWRGSGVTKVCGVEARGFILGGACATALHAGFVAIRKEGNLFPGPKHRVEAAPGYRGVPHVLEIQQRSVLPGDRLLLVDDWIERGSQATAARLLVEKCGAELAGIAVMVDELDASARSTLPLVTNIVTARDLPL
jgi:adenine phosphoribosyltransferase